MRDAQDLRIQAERRKSQGSAVDFAPTSGHATAGSAIRANDKRKLNERRAYYRLLRHLLSEKLEASYKEDQARSLPPRLAELLKTIEYRKPS